MNISHMAFAGLALLTLAGCSTTGTSDEDQGIQQYANDPRLGKEVEQICFVNNIDGFKMNKNLTVVLTVGVNQDYMVEVYGPCSPLRDALAIAPAKLAGGCLMRGDSLIVSDTMMPEGGDPFDVQRCTINKMYKWNDDGSNVGEMPITH